MRKIIFLALCLSLILLVGCNGADTEYDTNYEPQANEPEVESFAGFIEIQGNTLRIRPVEVFMLYSADDEFGFARETSIRSIVFIEQNDTGRLAELGLTLDDFPSGNHIRPNWHYVDAAGIETLSFEITNETEFVFVDSQLLFDTDPYGDRQRTTNSVDEFMEYLFPSVVHFIEVQGDRVLRLIQEFGFTM